MSNILKKKVSPGYMYKVYVKQKYILWLDMDLISNHLNVV